MLDSEGSYRRGEPAPAPTDGAAPPRGPGGLAGVSAAALDALPVAIFHLDPDGRFAGVNRPLLELLGMPDDDGLPATLREVVVEPARIDWWVAEAQAHGAVSLAAVLKGPGGRRVRTWVTLSRLAGAQAGLVGVVRPQRAELRPAASAEEPRAELEQALQLTEEWSRAIVAAADEVGVGLAISTLDDAGEARLAFINAAGAAMLGRTKAELRDGPAFPRLDPATEAALRDGRSAPSGVMVRLQRPDGVGVLIEAGLSLGAYWGRPALFAFFRDVTRERTLEAEERAAREQRLRDLEENARFKADLLNTAAHELFTPLTPIKLQLTLLKGLPGGHVEEQRRAVDMLDRNVDRLIRLLKDLLDVARIQGGRLAHEPRLLSLGKTLAEAVATYEGHARAHGVELVLDERPPVVVEADADRLLQVLGNLLSNAVKFTPPGGRVRVGAGVQGDEAVVSVADSGAGIRPADAAKMFQPFAQLQGGEGTGLGLYICKGIVERHGGRIWVESDGPGRGTAFFFSLPLKRPLPKG